MVGRRGCSGCHFYAWDADGVRDDVRAVVVQQGPGIVVRCGVLAC